MYINPFIVGVLVTIGVEVILLFVYAIHITRKK